MDIGRIYIKKTVDIDMINKQKLVENARGSGTVNQPFLYREQDESESPHLQKNLPVMNMSPTFSSTLPLRQ